MFLNNSLRRRPTQTGYHCIIIIIILTYLSIFSQSLCRGF